jgi:ubiquinone/menaquinone biosynthesis C-methylase UbiE
MTNLESSRKFWQKKASEIHTGMSRHTGFSGVSIWKDIRVRIGYQPKSTDSVVEIGCGVGRLSRAMSSEVGRIEAFDISQRMLDIAQHGRITQCHVSSEQPWTSWAEHATQPARR